MSGKRQLNSKSSSQQKKLKSQKSHLRVVGYDDDSDPRPTSSATMSSTSSSGGSSAQISNVHIRSFAIYNSGFIHENQLRLHHSVYDLSPPSINPLEEESTHYDVYGSLMADTDTFKDEGAAESMPPSVETPSPTVLSTLHKGKGVEKSKESKTKSNRMKVCFHICL